MPCIPTCRSSSWHLHGLPLLRLGRSMLAVSRVLTTPESSEPWAGFARFDELLARALL
jgi:hypothetical protein